MKFKYPDLELIIELSKTQKNIYRPSSFWDKASNKIIEDIKNFGIENFRRLETPLNYFVPNYGIPANSFSQDVVDDVYNILKLNGSKKQILAMQEFLSGYFHALSDYRVFLSADENNKHPRLNHFSESNYGNPIEQFEFNGKKYSRSSLNYILGLCFLKKFLSQKEEIKTVLEIGGGFGTLGEILTISNNIKYIDIDIPPVSFIAWKYLQNLNSNNIEPYFQEKPKIKIKKLRKCSVFNSWDIEKLEGNIDLFVNYISFQEMEPNIVENYLNHVMRLNTKWILLRNMREGKQVKKAANEIGVENPIKKDDYLKMMVGAYSFIDSNVYPFGYKTVDGFHSELLLFKRKDG